MDTLTASNTNAKVVNVRVDRRPAEALAQGHSGTMHPVIQYTFFIAKCKKFSALFFDGQRLRNYYNFAENQMTHAMNTAELGV